MQQQAARTQSVAEAEINRRLNGGTDGGPIGSVTWIASHKMLNQNSRKHQHWAMKCSLVNAFMSTRRFKYRR